MTEIKINLKVTSENLTLIVLSFVFRFYTKSHSFLHIALLHLDIMTPPHVSLQTPSLRLTGSQRTTWPGDYQCKHPPSLRLHLMVAHCPVLYNVAIHDTQYTGYTLYRGQENSLMNWTEAVLWVYICTCCNISVTWQTLTFRTHADHSTPDILVEVCKSQSTLLIRYTSSQWSFS